MNHNQIIELRQRLQPISRISIIGAERSGLSVAKVAKALGMDVFVSDYSKQKEQSEIKTKLDHLNVAYELGMHSNRIYENTDLIVVSPGVPKSATVLQKAQSLNIPIWSEIEFAFRLWKGKIIAITGSVAKSTVTAWIGEVLRNADIPYVLGGNIGIPFSEFVLEDSQDKWAVVEISSFQLEWVHTFSPTVAVVTNLIPNHLDRYHSVHEYYSAKVQITQKQSEVNWLILNDDDQNVQKYFSKFLRRTFPYSSEHPLERGVWLGHDRIMLRDTEMLPTKLAKFSDIQLIGRHNLSNACAVVAALYAASVPIDKIDKGLISFKGLPHRLQKISTNDDRLWYNDSKATTPEAAKVALTAFPSTVVWLAGGYNKGIDLSGLKKVAQKKVKHLITFGSSAETIEKEYQDVVQVTRVTTLKNAVLKAHEISTKGDVILLSPMCASFDEFHDFEERGKQFETYVKGLQC
ncbi:MAG: UDP-N-acetylmuramoyl-L-alanine--D-glutamate ligase [bacterium]|nr:UDP-N-acetylmuramoyl-L-alanine--D-glutamate ligase [bacterium]